MLGGTGRVGRRGDGRMGCTGDAAASYRSTADAGIGLRPGLFLRGDCRDHGLPREYRKNADVSRTRQIAHALAAARRNGKCLAISLKRLNRTHLWLHSTVIGPLLKREPMNLIHLEG